VTRTALMWFRRDLRLADNAALAAALEAGDAVVPVALLDDGRAGASSAWRARSLTALDGSLRERGSGLVLRSGPARKALTALAREAGAVVVTATRDWAPAAMAEEEDVRRALFAAGVGLEIREGQLLVTPDSLRTGQGRPYRVFTPFWRRWSTGWSPASPLPAPNHIPTPRPLPASSGPVSPAPGGPDMSRWWTPGEAGALERLADFSAGSAEDYDRDRDRPDLDATSRLSPYISQGEIGPAHIIRAVRAAGEGSGTEAFVRQLAWREFSYHVLHHFPQSATRALNDRFSAMPWIDDADGLATWRAGRTGYPLVDAGMRQLLATGWMHNRVRLVVGSFLTKDLLVRWQDGEAFFRERLVDFDPAANVFNWQWIAGSGADAAPYFRVFNPSVQGMKFDPEGAYVRTWVPELAGLPARWIHRPWEAPADVLGTAGVVLGESYPPPTVEHRDARERALAAYASLR